MLKIYRRLAEAASTNFDSYIAKILYNLSLLYYTQEHFVKAEKGYSEALEIYRRLAQSNPATFLPYVAVTAVSMSIFYLQVQPNQEKSIAYAKEALQSALPFIETVPSVLQYAQTAMQVLSAWGIDAQAFLQTIIAEMENIEGRK